MNLSLLLAVALAHAPADKTAAELLARAEKAAAQGKFGVADTYYKKIVVDFPDSDEVFVAEERLQPNTLLWVREISQHGDPENRVDVFVLAEGFKRAQKYQGTFDGLAEQTERLFFQVPTFKRYRPYFNFYSMNIASLEEKVDTEDRDYDTALGAYTTQYSQGQVGVKRDLVQQYLGMDDRSEGLAIVIVRRGTLGTGGGGVAVVGGGAGNTVVHEWGHAFGGLLDEYTADVGYRGPSPRGVNISDTDDPTRVPWKHWIEAKTKGVGVIPGGAGRSTGAWRSSGKQCSMARGASFCIVCRESLVRNIYGLVSPLDSATPEEERLRVSEGAPQTIGVIPLEVGAGEPLVVEFFVKAQPGAFEAPNPMYEVDTRYQAPSTRRNRGRARWYKDHNVPVAGESVKPKRSKVDGRRQYSLTLSTEDYEPGDYLVYVRVSDPTDWLIKKEWLDLLVETRVWRVRVEG